MSFVMMSKRRKPEVTSGRSKRPYAVSPRLEVRPIAHALERSGRPVEGQPSALDGIHAKLTVGPVNDPLEIEADAMADAVISGQKVGASGTNDGRTIHRKCSSCQDEEIHRKTSPSSRADPGADTLVGHARSMSGASMGGALRSRMESGFGSDFGNVRVHTGLAAAQAARSIGANAFTIGHDVFFGAGQFAPATTEGQRLIAHELAHVVQGDGVSSHTAWAGSSDDVIRLNPIKDRAREVVQDKGAEEFGLKDPEAIAALLIGELSSNPRAKDFVRYAMEASDVLGYSSVQYKRFVAENFIVQLVSPDQHKLACEKSKETTCGKGGSISLEQLGATAEGTWIIYYMTKNLSSDFAKRRPAAAKALSEYIKSIDLEHGRLSDESVRRIRKQNCPSSPDFRNFCMDAVLGNIEHACGSGTRMLIENLASKKYRTKGEPPLNSHNLNAAVELGLARRLGKSSFNRDVCIDTLAFTDDPDGGNDPFVFTREEGIEKMLTPNPEKVVLDAVNRARAGKYLFIASVAGHHAVSLILDKEQDAKVELGSSRYTLYWNDQFDDDLVGHERDDGTSAGTLGRARKGNALTKWIFWNTMVKKRNPALSTFWRDSLNHESFMQRNAPKPDAGNGSDKKKLIPKREIELIARNQRCTNAAGIELWQIIPPASVQFQSGVDPTKGECPGQ